MIWGNELIYIDGQSSNTSNIVSEKSYILHKNSWIITLLIVNIKNTQTKIAETRETSKIVGNTLNTIALRLKLMPLCMVFVLLRSSASLFIVDGLYSL